MSDRDWAVFAGVALVVLVIYLAARYIQREDVAPRHGYTETKIAISLNCDSENFDEAMARAKEALATFGVTSSAGAKVEFNAKPMGSEVKH